MRGNVIRKEGVGPAPGRRGQITVIFDPSNTNIRGYISGGNVTGLGIGVRPIYTRKVFDMNAND